MNENILVVGVLGAPVVGNAFENAFHNIAADPLKSLNQRFSSRLAAGIIEEVEARLNPASETLKGSLVRVIRADPDTVLGDIEGTVLASLASALEGEGVLLVPAVELKLLRELAASLSAILSGEVGQQTLFKLSYGNVGDAADVDAWINACALRAAYEASKKTEATSETADHPFSRTRQALAEIMQSID